MAADMPAIPEPATKTSVAASHLAGSWIVATSAADARLEMKAPAAAALEAAKKERRVVLFFLLELFLNFKEIVVPVPTRVT